MKRHFTAYLLFLILAALGASGAPLEELWQERIASVVSVEFFVDGELERQSTQTFGTVIDAQGTIIFPAEVINPKAATSQLNSFRVYRPGADAAEYWPATFLGHDELTGWAFVRVNDANAVRALTPITSYGVSPAPRIAQELWGIGLRKKEDGFAPYFLSSHVSLVQRLPQATALLARPVTGTSLPAFDREGRFAGLGVSGFGQAYLQFSSLDRGGLPVVLIDPDECAALLLADEVLPYLNRIPQSINGRPMVWLGTSGLQPLDPEVAAYLGLNDRTGLVVSEVLENSPAAFAGLMSRDVIVAIDGKPLPRLKPARAVMDYYQREVDRRSPGDVMTLGVIRDGRQLTVQAKLQDAPPLPRELPRHYFERLGFTLRDFAYVDGAARHVPMANHQGVIVNFIKPGSPAALAGLQADDWIRRIGATEVRGLDDAMNALDFIEEGAGPQSCLVVVDRGGQQVQLTIKTN